MPLTHCRQHPLAVSPARRIGALVGLCPFEIRDPPATNMLYASVQQGLAMSVAPAAAGPAQACWCPWWR